VRQAKAQCTVPDTCERNCEAGKPLACAQLGLWSQYGLNGVPLDEARAAELQQRACDMGAGVGCFNLASQRMYGIGVPSDHALGNALLAEAARLYEASCDAGGSTWCVNLASMLIMGQGVPQDAQKGMTLLRKACADKVDGACIQLAMVTGRTDKKARRVLLQEECGQGSMKACSYLGETYLDIEPVDPKVANMWFEMGCKINHSVGCRNLGVQHITGKGAPQDATRGLELLEAACTDAMEPDAGACHLAGITLRDGALGLMPDLQRAGERFVQACRMGQANACVDAVQLAATGASTVPSRAEAAQLTDMACRMGQPVACKLLRGG
jgi:TPR repeat protein